jgi:hypothetical protein
MSYKILAGQGRIFRSGAAFTVPTAGTAGQNSLPGAADGGWGDLGHIDLVLSPKVAKEEIVGAPAGKGRRQIRKVLVTQRDLSAKITLHELLTLIFELIFGCTITPGVAYSPNSARGIEAWIELKEYDDDDVLVNTHYHYVFLNPPSDVKLDEKHVQCEVEAQVLPSTVSTGTLVPATEAPQLVAATIGETGQTLALVFDRIISIGEGGNAGWVLTPSGAAATLAYESGAGTTALLYVISRAILGSETATLDYTQPTDGVEIPGGIDLASIADRSVVNNSAAA